MSTLTLPWPPAVNNLYTNVGKRRVRTARYDGWILHAQAAVLSQRPSRIRGPYHVSILLDRPDRIRRDIDGLGKAALDLLVKMGVTDDDSLAQSLTLAWSDKPPSKPGAAHVTYYAAGDPLGYAQMVDAVGAVKARAA